MFVYVVVLRDPSISKVVPSSVGAPIAAFSNEVSARLAFPGRVWTQVPGAVPDGLVYWLGREDGVATTLLARLEVDPLAI